MIQELATKLSKIEGVEGVVIAARDGIVLAHELKDSSPDKEGAVAVFVGHAATQASESLALGTFDWGTVTIGEEVVLVLEQPDYYVGLLLAERSSPSLVASSARQALE